MWCRVTTCPNKSRRWAWFRLGIRRLLHKFNNRPRFKRTTLLRVSLRCPVEKLCTSPANWQRRTSKALSISHNSFRHMLMHCLVDMQRRPRKPTAQIACVSTADSMWLTILNQLVIINKKGQVRTTRLPKSSICPPKPLRSSTAPNAWHVLEQRRASSTNGSSFIMS